MSKQKGFSLLEVLVSIGIASCCLLAVMMISSSGTQYFHYFQRYTALVQDTIFLTDYFSRDLESIGGGALRPWGAIWIEDSSETSSCAAHHVFPNCNHSDRVTLIQTPMEAPSCAIVQALTATSLEGARNSSNICCFTNELVNKQAALVLNDFYRQVYITGIVSTASACRATIQPGPAADNDRPDPTGNWLNSNLLAVEVKTIYLDTEKHLLMRYNHLNNQQHASLPGEPLNPSVLADQVFDFQMASGFDFNPSDGVITDTGSDSDEWLYNAQGEARGTGVFASATPSQLRMVQVGLITGSKTTAPMARTSARVLNGKERVLGQGWTLESSTIKVTPRNQFIFQ